MSTEAAAAIRTCIPPFNLVAMDPLPVVTTVANHFNHDRQCQNQRLVRLVLVDVDEISIAQPEPLSGKSGDFAIAAFHDVLEIDNVSDCFKVRRSRRVNQEAVAAEREQISADGTCTFSIAPKLVTIEGLLLDVNELVPFEILHGEFVADAKRSAFTRNASWPFTSLVCEFIPSEARFCFKSYFNVADCPLRVFSLLLPCGF